MAMGMTKIIKEVLSVYNAMHRSREIMKYIIVTGGVLSGLGKGISASSIGKLLKSRGLKVTAIKIDPYLNCDAGTMNPYQHGEVYVLEDGGEVDLDLGNYERFLDIDLTSEHNITTGKVYKAVIEKERRGDYLGNTVQIIPHITNEIRERIKDVAEKSKVDVVIVELGGTVGDIESMPFLEAVRQLHREVGDENLIFVHTTLVPIIGVVGEQKTKPTQHSVKELRAIGIQPDIIIGRSEKLLSKETKRKISLFCDVPESGVVSAPDATSIYEVPLILERQGLTDFLLKRLGLRARRDDLKDWKRFVQKLNAKSSVEIAVVGKYVHLKDSYISISEAFKHSGAKANVRVKVRWIEAEDLEEDCSLLDGVQGILVPGGFGQRGTEGKILAIKYARERCIPFLGICLGFQMAIVEFARNVLRYKDANSSEFDRETKHPVIDLLPEQKKVKDLGGTMRLGANNIVIEKGSLAYRLYKSTTISERHRHRYEVNPEFIPKIESAGLRFTGKSYNNKRMEIAEISNHRYFIASQFHPEFKSRPGNPAPLFLGLVQSARKTI